jgi:hypothetical protein
MRAVAPLEQLSPQRLGGLVVSFLAAVTPVVGLAIQRGPECGLRGPILLWTIWMIAFPVAFTWFVSETAMVTGKVPRWVAMPAAFAVYLAVGTLLWALWFESEWIPLWMTRIFKFETCD